MKVVINRAYGNFELTEEAYLALIARGWTVTEFDFKLGDYVDPCADLVAASDYVPGSYHPRKGSHLPAFRTHPDVIQVVEELGARAWDQELSDLKVVEIPDGIDWYISNEDGLETIREVHRYWPNGEEDK